MSPPTPAPAPASTPASLLARARQAWQGLSPREQKLLVSAAGVVALALLVATFEWSRSERLRLARSLPRAAARLEQVQEAATEIARLKAQSSAPRASGPALLELVQASAKSRSLALNIQAGGEGLHISGQAGFDELVGWLAALQQDQGLRVLRMELQPQGALTSLDVLLVRSE